MIDLVTKFIKYTKALASIPFSNITWYDVLVVLPVVLLAKQVIFTNPNRLFVNGFIIIKLPFLNVLKLK